MEVKPGYKQTEVGVIPEDWEVEVVSETAIVRRRSDRHDLELTDDTVSHRSIFHDMTVAA